MENQLEQSEQYISASPEEQLYFSIQDDLESFNNLTEEQQDYFLDLANRLVKYRGKSLYEDLPEEVENTQISNIEKMVQQLLKDKSSRDSKIEIIPNKRNLSIEEFEKEFTISRSSQQRLRGRGMPINPQVLKGSRVIYDYDTVKQWMKENGI
ncbi:MAG: hypothetical protein Q8J85_07310 [Sulfuricurvum sp.]|nr:hypothetical protein [Sulfuricurvum sp.]MDP3022965.1 hypothetical protein [Sulfuricurvum sp.]